MKKRVLVMYARYGSGHKSIAEYVAKYIEEQNDVDVMLLDMTGYANKLGKLSVKITDFTAIYRPEKICDTWYELTNHKISAKGTNAMVKKSYDNKRLRKVIQDFNPDITISTQVFCSSIITIYNSLGLINSLLYTIVTDYKVHESWTSNYKTEDGYIVGNSMVKNELVSRGIPVNKIYDFGLPLNISQINNLDEEERILERYNLSGSRKIYLFFGGASAGSMYYYDYLKTLINLEINADIIFVCGKNVKLKNRCDKLIKRKKIKNVKILGYTNDVFSLFKISDLVITKPGGATITEALEMHTPLLLVPGVGGQEKYNAKFISKMKYGIRTKGLWSFKMWIKRLEEKPEIIYNIKRRLDMQKENKAVEKINDLVMRMLNGKNKWTNN